MFSLPTVRRPQATKNQRQPPNHPPPPSVSTKHFCSSSSSSAHAHTHAGPDSGLHPFFPYRQKQHQVNERKTIAAVEEHKPKQTYSNNSCSVLVKELPVKSSHLLYIIVLANLWRFHTLINNCYFTAARSFLPPSSPTTPITQSWNKNDPTCLLVDVFISDHFCMPKRT